MGAVHKLKSENFHENFFSSLRNLRTQRVGLNLSLISKDGVEMRVHSVVMAAASAFIRNKIHDDTSSCVSHRFHNVSTRCLETLVTFAYSGEMDFTGCDPSAIWPLLRACSELQMPDALHLCNKFLEATTNRNSSSNNQLESSHNNNNSRRKVTSHGNDDDSDDVSLRHLQDAAKRKRGRPSVGTKPEGRPTKRSRKGRSTSRAARSPEAKSPSVSSSQKHSSDVVTDKLKCDQCDRTFQLNSQLTLHHRNAHIHRSQRHHRVRRIVGSRAFMWNAARKIHVTGNCSENGAKCRCLRCGKTFKLWSTFTFHWTFKHERKRRCLHCDVTFCSRLDLREHEHKNHAQKITAERDRDRKSRWKCARCDRRFLHARTLERHASRRHSDGRRRQQPERETVKRKRGTSSKGKKAKNQSEPAPSPSLQINVCVQCGKPFKRRGSLRDHLASKHNVGGIRCNQCDRAFVSKRDYNDHMDAVHYNNRKYSCDACAKTFVRKSSCSRHMKEQCKNPLYHLKPRKPVEEKHFQCPLCMNWYTTPQSLKEHIKTIHTCQMYPCKVPGCYASFRFRSSRKKHVDSKHREYRPVS